MWALVVGSISDMEGEKDMMCPNCKRGVISYYQFCPWCGTDVRRSQMTRDQEVQMLRSQMGLLQGQLDQILKTLEELEEKK